MYNTLNRYNTLYVRKSGDRFEATLDGKTYPCAVGKSGFISATTKKEGDGATPIGIFPLRRLFYRPDVYTSTDLKTDLPAQAIRQTDGWCDESKDPRYNTLVDLTAFDATISHEKMWREDALYNIVIEVGYNDAPPVSMKGSAIFIHIARPGYSGTEGCVAFSEPDLRDIITKISPASMIVIEG